MAVGEPAADDREMHPTDALLALAETQHGVVAHRQARALGMDRRSVRRLAATRHWEPVTDEVIRRRGTPATDGQRLVAAVLDAGSTAALSHVSAASWWGLSGCRRFPAHVVRTTRSTRGSEIAEVHTVRSLPPRWIRILDGVTVVAPELLALHLYATCREERAERLVETLWAMRLLSGASIASFLDELGRKGRDGTAGLRRYLADRGPGYVPTATGVEARVAQILRDAGILLRRQVDSGGERWTGRVDFADTELPFRLEVQSERYHSALVDRAADRERIARLRSDGFVVAEVTDTQVWTRPGEVVEIVRRGLESASRAVRSVAVASRSVRRSTTEL